MANPDDVSLFESGVEAWNDAVVARHQHQPGTRRPSALYIADLSDSRLGRRASARWVRDKNRVSTLADLISYPRAELAFCDLRRTDFRVNFIGFDFRASNFALCKLAEADLTAADLTAATFIGADLRDAVLRGAKIDRARFSGADLTGTDLTATSPWRARLFDETPATTLDAELGSKSVSSVSDLISICSVLTNSTESKDYRFYYRGEPRRWKLRPSVMRSRRLRNAESAMLTELMTQRPQKFGQTRSALDQWVLAQHYRLKTRLLDVTRNPLVGLFFACEGDSHQEEEGRLHVFAVPRSMVKPFHSDSISIVTNFAKLSHPEQSTLLGKRRHATFNYQTAIRRLYHLIGEEKPQFVRRIDPRDFFRVYAVEPKASFARLAAQSGAFLISAFHERFERDMILRTNDAIPVYAQFTLRIPAVYKAPILSELAFLDVTRDSLFPSLDEAAKAIAARHRDSSSKDLYGPQATGNATWRELMYFPDYPKRELPPARPIPIPELPPDPVETVDSSDSTNERGAAD